MDNRIGARKVIKKARLYKMELTENDLEYIKKELVHELCDFIIENHNEMLDLERHEYPELDEVELRIDAMLIDAKEYRRLKEIERDYSKIIKNVFTNK